MLTTTASFDLFTRDIDRTRARITAQPEVAREIEYYKETIGSIKSAEDLIANTRLFEFTMTAMGLGEMAYAKGFMAKVLKEGVDDESSFANSLSDSRYREYAEVFNFVAFESATTSFSRVQDGVVDKYIQQTLEEQAGQDNNGVRLAIYFERKAPEISNYFEILADPALAQVVRTALGLPQELVAADIDKQAEIIASRLDLDDLKSPEKLSEFILRFTSLWDVTRDPTASSDPIIGLFSQAPASSINLDLLLSMQRTR